MANSAQDCYKEAQTYVSANLSACIREVVEWYDTGLLTQGHVRKIVDILEKDGLTTTIGALHNARSIVEQTVVRKVHAELEEGRALMRNT